MIRRGVFTLFLVIVAGIILPAAAQPGLDTAWRRGGYLSTNLNQISLSSWAAGGENAVGFDFQAGYFANFQRDRHLWNNRLDVAYGLNWTKSDGTKKTNDRLYLSSLYGYELTRNLYLSGLFSFQTQFAKGYNYNMDPKVYISRFMSPGYLLMGAGLTWTPKPWFLATLAPATWRGTFVTSDVLSDEGQFGVDPGKHFRSEFGANLRMEVQYEFLKNMTVFSRLSLYSNYLDKPQNIDVEWDVQLSMSINKWFATTVTTNLIYDNDTKILQKDGSRGPRVQFKEALAVGFQFTF